MRWEIEHGTAPSPYGLLLTGWYVVAYFDGQAEEVYRKGPFETRGEAERKRVLLRKQSGLDPVLG